MSSELSQLSDRLGELREALDVWATRDDSHAQPEVRRAANTAMDAIDGMLRDLHAIRERLFVEIRASDDATDVRIERLLHRLARQ